MDTKEHLKILRVVFVLSLLPFAYLLLAILIELSGKDVEVMIRDGFYPSAFGGIFTSLALSVYSLYFHFYKFALCGIVMLIFNIGIVWFEYQVLLGYAC